MLGLFITWPTSYEALVGRAELKPGESSHRACLARVLTIHSRRIYPRPCGCRRCWHCCCSIGQRFVLFQNGFPSFDLPYTSALGATVIAAAGSQSKLDICKTYGGADYTVNYTEKDWQKEVLRITGGKGVDVVYDPVGRIAGECYFRG